MRIMNTPTADRNPIASGDTKRNRKKHICKKILSKFNSQKLEYLSELIVNKYYPCAKHDMQDVTKKTPFKFEVMYNHLFKDQRSIWF